MHYKITHYCSHEKEYTQKIDLTEETLQRRLKNTLCEDCFINEQKKLYNKILENANTLAELKGENHEILWAEKIRAKAFLEIESSLQQMNNNLASLSIEQKEAFAHNITELEQAIIALRAETNAINWLKTSYMSGHTLITNIIKKNRELIETSNKTDN